MLPSFLLTAPIADEVFKSFLNDNPLQATAYSAAIAIDEAGATDAFEALVVQHINNGSSAFQFYSALHDFTATRYLRSTRWIAACLAGTATY